MNYKKLNSNIKLLYIYYVIHEMKQFITLNLLSAPVQDLSFDNFSRCKDKYETANSIAIVLSVCEFNNSYKYNINFSPNLNTSCFKLDYEAFPCYE